MIITREYLIANGWNIKNNPSRRLVNVFYTHYTLINEYGYYFDIREEDGEWWLYIDDTRHMSCGSLCIQSIEMLEYLIKNYGKLK